PHMPQGFACAASWGATVARPLFEVKRSARGWRSEIGGTESLGERQLLHPVTLFGVVGPGVFMRGLRRSVLWRGNRGLRLGKRGPLTHPRRSSRWMRPLRARHRRTHKARPKT